jgi:hypothetical protein
LRVFLLIAVVAGAGVVPFAQRGGERAPVAARFHHLHYVVADPGAALGEVADRLKGTRAIVQGVGVGVRVGREYVLLGRESDGLARGSGRGRRPSAAFAEAVTWLRAQGVSASPGSLSETGVDVVPDGAALDHVGFAVDDVAAIASVVKVRPLSASADALRFRLRSGAIVEIVRDTDRPDAFWCPMHPDVRTPSIGTCPRCKMALVPIPPPRIGEYRLDVAMRPRPGGGVSGLTFAVRDPESSEPVTTFLDVHEKPFHLFAVSRDLRTFAHLHPERRDDGSFELRHDFAPGAYLLIADFLPAGGTSQLVHRAIVTPGYEGPIFGEPASLPDMPAEQTVEGIRIRLEPVTPIARRETPLRFVIADAATGAAITDLEPYLGASGHLLIVSADLSTAIHGHPDGDVTRGPAVRFDALFPAPGRYKLWVQLQRKGTVITAPFVIEVPRSSR